MITASIRRFILQLPKNQMFVTRDVLGFGRRSAVDTALSRLVSDGMIERVARGVFVRAGARLFLPVEVAAIKARAFAKKIAIHPINLAVHLGLSEYLTSKETLFATSGVSSSFLFGPKRIEFHHNSPRKMLLGESRAAHAIKALWQLGNGIEQRK